MTSHIVRIMRPLSAINLVEETDPDTYAATPITRAMAIPSIAAGHIHLSVTIAFNCRTY